MSAGVVGDEHAALNRVIQQLIARFGHLGPYMPKGAMLARVFVMVDIKRPV